MVALNFNAAQVAPQTAIDPIPSGIYPVVITASEEKPTRSGDGTYLELEMTVTNYAADPKLNGRKVYDRLNLRNKNQQAVEIAYSTLSAICHVTGRIHVQDSSQLHGVPFQAVVIKKKRDDQPDMFTNEIRGYKDINGNDPGQGGMAPAQQQAAPQWAQPGQPAPQPQQAMPPQGQPQWSAPPAQQPPPQQYQQPPQGAPQPQYAPPPQQAQQPPQQPGWANPPTMPTEQQQAPQQAQQQPQQAPYNGPPAGPAGAAPSAPAWAR